LNPAWDAPSIELPHEVAVFGQDDVGLDVITTQTIKQVEEGSAGTVETVVVGDEKDVHFVLSWGEIQLGQ
jgi:hypothetical protein